jgi:lactoylglutathione lyase
VTRVAHVALWTADEGRLERLREFYETYFGGRAGPRYESARRRGFVSYFVEFRDDAGAADAVRLELMTAPGVFTRPPGDDIAGWAHVALSVGSREAVDALAARLAADPGVPVVSGPRLTGDGYYEAVVRDPDGNLVEIVA